MKELLAHPQTNVNQAQTTTGVTPLLIASQIGHVEVVKELLDHPQTDVTHVNQGLTADGATPLFLASQNGHVEVVKALLADPRVDPNKLRTKWKDNAISIALHYNGNLEVVKLLLRCPDVILGVKDKDGKTELDYAKEKGFPENVKAIESRQTLLQQDHTC